MNNRADQKNDLIDKSGFHVPVLLTEMLKALQPSKDEVYIDGTFGAGGYSRAILESALCRVIGIDQDPMAIKLARPLLKEFGSRLEVFHGRYSDMKEPLRVKGIDYVDGVVLDIGVSSMQLDNEERGFSFRTEGPLDMRMSSSGPTAADLVNGLAEDEIAEILWRFGEEKKSRQIASAIVKRRKQSKFSNTLELAELVASIVKQPHHDKKHPATRTFQALRVYLNDELGELLKGLNEASKCLKPGGRLVVVTFHSLEDRIVKNYFKAAAQRVPNQSRHLPDVHKKPLPSFHIINSKVVKSNDEEIRINTRARSAKLRYAVRTDNPSLCFDEESLGLKSFQL